MLMPSRTSIKLREIFAWIIILAPLTMTLGVTAYILLGLVLTWRFYSKTDKIATALLLAYLFLLPGILKLNYQFLTASFPDSLVSTIWKAQYYVEDEQVIHQLLQIQKNNPDDSDVNFVLGIINQRRAGENIGNFDLVNLTPNQHQIVNKEKEQVQSLLNNALNLYTKAADKNPALKKLAENNIGNLYFNMFQNTKDSKYLVMAEKKYDSAPLASAIVNKSQIFTQENNLTDAKDMWDKAHATDPNIFHRTQIINSHPNRVVLNEYLPDSFLWDRVKAPVQVENKDLNALWFGRIKGVNLDQLPKISIIAFVLMIGLSFLKGSTEKLKECTVCGRVVDPTTWRKVQNNLLCMNCYQSTAGTKLDTMRFALLAKLRRSGEEKRFILSLIYGILFPGTGHLYKNSVIFGYILIAVNSVYLTTWLFKKDLYYINNDFPYGFTSLFSIIMVIIIGIVIYAINLSSLVMLGLDLKTAKDYQTDMTPAKTTETENKPPEES